MSPSKSKIRNLGLDHPEFGKVAARFGFFGAERRAKGVNLAQGHGAGFAVKLAGLREVGLLSEVIGFEERRRCLRRPTA